MTRTLRAILVTLGDPSQLTGGYLFHRRLAELAAAQAASLEFVSLPDRTFPLGMLAAPRVITEVEQRRPDVIVVDSIIAWCFAVQGARTPMVGMLHQPPGGIDFGPLRTRVQAALDRRAYRRLTTVLVASESLADEMQPLGLDLRVVPPGRDVAASTGPPPGDVRRGRRVALLCVGNWVERKGILSLLEAFAGLEDSAATLHLVGRSNIDSKYARQVWSRLGRPDLVGRVVVHGPLEVGGVAALYASVDAFVLPSLKEPYGTVYGEAMAFGLPVVGWRAGNLPYLADEGREGLLVEPGDVLGLSVALRRITDDPELRDRLGAAARQRALARPTWDQVAALFFDELRAAINRRDR
jgi:glycosyltransferase involved in cell wall biosynthesis